MSSPGNGANFRDRQPGPARYVYTFANGNRDMRDLLGGKGANLAEMTRIGLPVPPGFTVTTAACLDYFAGGEGVQQILEDQVFAALRQLEEDTGKGFGDPEQPLLLSVRSGAPVSMPGMMDTVLNLGMNDATVEGLARETGDPGFAYDCYRRLIQMFSNVILGLESERFERLLSERKHRAGVRAERELGVEELRQVVAEFQQLLKEQGYDFPQEPHEQLRQAIRAVFDSWHNPRARTYRRMYDIPDELGTAVNVQVMVFGNMGENSGTGVLFTRDPNTGAPELYGEYLQNAQGEDVVAGIRTPQPVATLRDQQPEVYRQLEEAARLLESHYRDMQDIEFTVERGRLFILQTRSGKRAAPAAVKIAYDMVEDGIISREEALLRVEPQQAAQLLHRSVDPAAGGDPVARGLPASPGAAAGTVVFDTDEAVRRAERGDKVILVRTETTPDDLHGMEAAEGILTSRGGMTCHAAIVARGMGKPAVVGCDSLAIDSGGGQARVGETAFRDGDQLTIDGTTGRIFLGQVPTVSPELSGEFRTLLAWADEVRQLGVRANADTPEDAERARDFGAQGIGLCRTEHMFRGRDRFTAVQRMILAERHADRREALAALLPLQKDDFAGIFRAMDGYPVTIRLLDPPLHEFLPDLEELIARVAVLRQERGADDQELREAERLLAKTRVLHESNPMMGHRGCRLGITFPEVYEMQVRALLEAAAEAMQAGIDVQPEVMIPLVSHVEELRRLREKVEQIAARVLEETGVQVPYLVGTMIEVPRACLTAADIAAHADFFSFGTNDLTQMTFAFSRDDAEGKFLPIYIGEGVLPTNPFITLDQEGVGRLMQMARNDALAARPDLKLGICGEHGGDPASIRFCQQVGLNYVSCSPFRVPVARLAAAQATLQEGGQTTAAETR